MVIPLSRPERVVASTLVVLGAIGLGLAAQEAAFGWDRPRSWVPDLLVGTGLVVGAAVAWARGAAPTWTAGLVVLAGVVWWSTNFATLQSEWVAWLAAQLAFAHRALLVHAVLTGLGAVRRWDGRVVLVGAYVGSSPALAASWEWCAVLALGVTALAARGHRAVGAREHAIGWATAAALVVGATIAVAGIQDLLGVPGGLGLMLYQVGVLATGVILTAPWRRADPALASELVRLAEASTGIAAVLSDVTGDPGVRVVEGSGDGPGTESLGVGYVATPVSTAGSTGEGRTTYLVHREELRQDPELLASLVRAVGLLLENDRLQADLRARGDDVERSRARLLRVADEEAARLRARIQRGAGARLDTVVAQLRRAGGAVGARGAPDSPSALLDAAVERAVRVRQDLAEVEHALVPDFERVSLAEALAELAGTSPVPVSLGIEHQLAVPRDVAAVAWFVCAEGLANVARHARATRAGIVVAADDGGVRVEVRDDGTGIDGNGAGAGLRNLRDRVEAVGGQLHVGAAHPSGTTVAAELPLDGHG